jgi:hypothetical protein
VNSFELLEMAQSFVSSVRSNLLVKLSSIPIAAPKNPPDIYADKVTYGSILPINASKNVTPYMKLKTEIIFRFLVLIVRVLFINEKREKPQCLL